MSRHDLWNATWLAVGPALMGSAVRGFQSANKNQPGFAASSVCDRIAFASWIRRNRTADLPSREKGSKACPRRKVGHFLQSGLREQFAKLRPFRAIFQGLQPVFSATQTAWRRERDSNPRYGFPHSGFQDVPFSPPSLVFKHLQSDWMLLCRAQGTSHSAVIVLRFVLQNSSMFGLQAGQGCSANAVTGHVIEYTLPQVISCFIGDDRRSGGRDRGRDSRRA